jgi:hypothetical protein
VSGARGAKREHEERDGGAKKRQRDLKTESGKDAGKDAGEDGVPTPTGSVSGAGGEDKDAYTALSRLSVQARDTGVKLKRIADRTKQDPVEQAKLYALSAISFMEHAGKEETLSVGMRKGTGSRAVGLFQQTAKLFVHSAYLYQALVGAEPASADASGGKAGDAVARLKHQRLSATRCCHPDGVTDGQSTYPPSPPRRRRRRPPRP